MEIFRVVVYMFQMLGKLILGIVHLIGRLFYGGEKKKIEQDDDMKEIFGDDIAMEGDRGIADCFGGKMELGKTIANGHKICQIRFYKKM